MARFSQKWYRQRGHLAASLTASLFALLLSGSVSADFQCFMPEADTFVSDYFGAGRDLNHGRATTLEVGSLGDTSLDRRNIFLRFNLEIIPADATILSADLRLYLRDILESTESQTFTQVRAVQQTWTEMGVTWNNQPTLGATVYDQQTISEISNVPGIRAWNVEALVSSWVRGGLANRGLALVSAGISSPAAIFDSTEARTGNMPRLCVGWTRDAVDVDLSVSAIEVTQGIQDLNNSVRLVAGKPTYVRVHVDSTSILGFRTFATLRADNGSNVVVLEPINEGAGHIVIRRSPNRELLNNSFLFQLPNGFVSGNLSLTATVNPITSWRSSRYPQETRYTNNLRSVSVAFESVPRIGIIAYLADYSVEDSGTVEVSTPSLDFRQMVSWVKRVFPVSDVWFAIRRVDFGEREWSLNDRGRRVFDNLGSGDVNAELKQQRNTDLNATKVWYADRVGNIADVRYYGMVSDQGAFMRGAGGIPGNTSSGPTGPGTFGWDTDGSYGDWYGGHELGHNFNRTHAVAGCGSTGGSGYPYPRGMISPELSGDQAIFGFDTNAAFRTQGAALDQRLAIYGPGWRDVTSYCSNQWISDYTYHGLMDYLQESITPRSVAAAALREAEAAGAPEAAPVVRAGATDRYSVVGLINPETAATTLRPIFIVPDAVELEPRVPGDHAIVLQGESGAELARYPFTPGEIESGPDISGPVDREVSFRFISELVPHVAGTRHLVIEGPQGELTRVSAGLAMPSINLTSPNGGELITEDPVTVSWSASDADGDSLNFKVQFSRDGGISWATVGQATGGNSTQIPRANLPTTSNGLFRVWVTDGLNTAFDTSDASFRLQARPVEIRVISPAANSFVSRGQTLNLEIEAFSPNLGALERNQVTWVSSIDGILGNGEQLPVTGLSAGVHNLVVLANDGTGGFATLASVEISNITVVDHPGLLPAPRNELELGPAALLFRPEFNESSQNLFIDNLGGERGLAWQAFAVNSWVKLSVASGTTPARIEVTIDTSALEPGEYESRIVVGSADTPGRFEVIPVHLWTHPRTGDDPLFRDRFQSGGFLRFGR